MVHGVSCPLTEQAIQSTMNTDGLRILKKTDVQPVVIVLLTEDKCTFSNMYIKGNQKSTYVTVPHCQKCCG